MVKFTSVGTGTRTTMPSQAPRPQTQQPDAVRSPRSSTSRHGQAQTECPCYDRRLMRKLPTANCSLPGSPRASPPAGGDDNGVFLLFQYVFSKLCFSMVHIKNKFNQKPGNSNTLCVKVLLFCMIMFSIICPAQEFSPSKQDDANAEDFPVASDINVAETALKDGLTKLARERALAAFYSPDSSQLIRNRAFRVLMTICEKELTVSDFSDLIDSESFDDKPWPAGDASFHVLRLYWQGRVLALSKRFEEASEILDIVDSPKTDPFLKLAAIRLLAYCMAVSGDELSAADVLVELDEGQPESRPGKARLLLNAGRQNLLLVWHL